MPNQPRDLSRVRSAAQPTGYTIREHRIPTEDARPYILAQGPDGHIWFCEHGADKIGRLSTIDYRFSEFSLPAKSEAVAVALRRHGSALRRNRHGLLLDGLRDT